jgi:hypothetical protein
MYLEYQFDTALLDSEPKLAAIFLPCAIEL